MFKKSLIIFALLFLYVISVELQLPKSFIIWFATLVCICINIEIVLLYEMTPPHPFKVLLYGIILFSVAYIYPSIIGYIFIVTITIFIYRELISPHPRQQVRQTDSPDNISNIVS